MAIRQSNDSLSKCDPNAYGALYDVSKPKLKVAAEVAQPKIHKDTIEINSDKLKKEALERLRHDSKYLLFQNSFMRIGKYLFVAVAFPPYLLVYGLPKWILAQAVPVLMTLIVNFSEKVQDQVKKRTDTIVKKISQFAGFLQKTASSLIYPVVKTWKAFQQKIMRFRLRSQILFNDAREKAKIIFKNPLQAFKKTIGSLKNPLVKFNQWASTKGSRFGERIQEQLASFKSGPENILPWMATKFQHLKDYALRWPMKWKGNFQKSQRIAQTTSQLLAKGTEEIKKLLSLFTSPLKVMIKENIIPGLNKLGTKLKEFTSRARDGLDQRKKRMILALKHLEERIKKTTFIQVYHSILSFISNLGLPALWEKVIKNFLTNSIVQAILKGLFKVFSVASILTMKSLQHGIEGTSKLIQYILVGFEWLCSYPKKGLVIFFMGLGTAFEYMGKVFHKIFYLFLLFLIMTIITFVWGVRSGKRMMDRALNF